jgi:hypothetical protein
VPRNALVRTLLTILKPNDADVQRVIHALNDNRYLAEFLQKDATWKANVLATVDPDDDFAVYNRAVEFAVKLANIWTNWTPMNTQYLSLGGFLPFVAFAQNGVITIQPMDVLNLTAEQRAFLQAMVDKGDFNVLNRALQLTDDQRQALTQTVTDALRPPRQLSDEYLAAVQAAKAARLREEQQKAAAAAVQAAEAARLREEQQKAAAAAVQAAEAARLREEQQKAAAAAAAEDASKRQRTETRMRQLQKERQQPSEAPGTVTAKAKLSRAEKLAAERRAAEEELQKATEESDRLKANARQAEVEALRKTSRVMALKREQIDLQAEQRRKENEKAEYDRLLDEYAERGKLLAVLPPHLQKKTREEMQQLEREMQRYDPEYRAKREREKEAREQEEELKREQRIQQQAEETRRIQALADAEAKRKMEKRKIPPLVRRLWKILKTEHPNFTHPRLDSVLTVMSSKAFQEYVDQDNWWKYNVARVMDAAFPEMTRSIFSRPRGPGDPFAVYLKVVEFAVKLAAYLDEKPDVSTDYLSVGGPLRLVFHPDTKLPVAHRDDSYKQLPHHDKLANFPYWFSTWNDDGMNREERNRLFDVFKTALRPPAELAQEALANPPQSYEALHEEWLRDKERQREERRRSQEEWWNQRNERLRREAEEREAYERQFRPRYTSPPRSASPPPRGYSPPPRSQGPPPRRQSPPRARAPPRSQSPPPRRQAPLDPNEIQANGMSRACNTFLCEDMGTTVWNKDLYKKYARYMHPDKPHGSEEKFKMVANCYHDFELLGKPEVKLPCSGRRAPR